MTVQWENILKESNKGLANIKAVRVDVDEEECETIMEVLGCLNQLQLISKAATELLDS